MMQNPVERERAPREAEMGEPYRRSSARPRRWAAVSISLLPSALLTLMTLAFRLPTVINAAAINSDMAVVGLQAMHILRGEWSWTLWGTDYQSPVDALLSAFVFAFAGTSARALAMVPVLGHLIFVATVYAVLKSNFKPRQAFLLTLPAVVTPMAINYNLIMVQRQACMTMFGVSVWLLDGAAGSRRPLSRYALGTWCVFLSVCFDLYGLQWVPAVLVLAFLSSLDAPYTRRKLLKRWGASALGIVAGFGTYLLLRSTTHGSAAKVSLRLARLPLNFELLSDSCLPWALGYRVFFNDGASGTGEWPAASWFHVVQLSGAYIVALAVLFAAVAIFSRRIPWPVRRIGFFGALVTASTLGAFLLSVMPADHWGTRYLAPMILVLPFSFAPAAYCLRRTPIGALAVVIYGISAGVGGWMSYGLDYRSGIWPLPTAVGRAEEEQKLAEFLRARKIYAGTAQYWLAYRLTFLLQENPVIVPLNPAQDRYKPYREAFDGAHDVAYIVHPSMPWVTADGQRKELHESGARYDQFNVARYTVFIEHR